MRGGYLPCSSPEDLDGTHAICTGAEEFVSAGCGPRRSVAAYCKTFYGEGSKIRAQSEDAVRSNNSIEQMATVFEAPSQLYQFFKKLDDVAPEDIQPDVETLRDAFKQQADSIGGDAGDPIGGMVGGLARGLASAGATQRVDKWTLDNCGPPPSN